VAWERAAAGSQASVPAAGLPPLDPWDIMLLDNFVTSNTAITYAVQAGEACSSAAGCLECASVACLELESPCFPGWLFTIWLKYVLP
jgi:hypothetical protein